MLRRFELLKHLSSTQSISGTLLAERLGISRAAVWQQIERLRRDGRVILADEGGYRLATPFVPLDATQITSLLRRHVPGLEIPVTVSEMTGSTNDDLLARWAAGESIHRAVTLAEFQRVGRGRRGGRWLSAPGEGLCLSVGYTFAQTPADVATAGLVAALAARRAIVRETGLIPQVKWPNDLLLNGAKLGGILTEMRAELQGASALVIGVGLNVGRASEMAQRSGQPVADLVGAGIVADRNRIAAAFIAELFSLLERLVTQGFGSLLPEWTEADGLCGQRVTLTPEPPCAADACLPSDVETDGIEGEVLGVGPDGGLRLLTSTGERTLYSGHVVRTGGACRAR